MNDPDYEPLEIGPYRILGVLGEGGMGVVYTAEQRQPITRRVALKVIKIGMDTKEVLARFEAERQALALLDHPNIAKVLDAGATAEGRPFFAMELVRGLPITRYCDEARLSVPDRVELLQQACLALQHAHERGILHRDIKPSNLLVTEIDGKAVVKVIDFGLAKATNQRLTERTLFTEEGRIIGTPEYMSPEQAETSAQDVDARSDVFSLGVVLYELLAGALPFDFQAARAKGYFEVQRFIREEEPPTPTRRLTGLRASLDQILALRRCRLQELTGSLRNGLDAVTMKAIAKQRRDRYASCADLAADLGRFHAGEPVMARRLGALAASRFQWRRFRRRHPVALPALLLATAAVGATAWVMRRDEMPGREVGFEETVSPRGVASQGSLRDGEQVGTWEFFYESGAVRARGRYDEDKRVGLWTYYHENGRVEWIGAFDRGGRRTGPWVFNFPGGMVRSMGTYLEDKEDGVWTFSFVDGAVERSGQYDEGRMSGPWQYFHSLGKLRAEGLCHRGQRVGRWRLWNATGDETVQDFGSPPGVTLVMEQWPNGRRRRAGVLQDDLPVGRWTSWHANGNLRFCCTRNAAVLSGVFEARDVAGNLVAEGVLAESRFEEGSMAFEKGRARPIAPDGMPAPAAAWATGKALADLPPEQMVATLCAELMAPADPVPPPPLEGAVLSPQPTEPVSAPELSVAQRQEINAKVQSYLEDTERPLLQKVQQDLREVGVLEAADGTLIDLRQFVGKKQVLLVVMRRFYGEVCTHCAAQTRFVAQSRQDLEALNIEVIVIYPGLKENAESFSKVYTMEFGQAPPPYRIVFDGDAEITQKLGGELTMPMTVLIDEEGRVQHRYVGPNQSDRMHARDLTHLIQRLKS